MFFLLLSDLRDYLEKALETLPLLSPESRGNPAALRAPRVMIGELPPRNQGEKEETAYPFVLLRASSGEDYEDGSLCEIAIICAVSAVERGEAMEHEIQNLLSFVRTALLKRRQVSGRGELVPDKQGRLLSWKVYEEFSFPYMGAQINGLWRVPGIQLTEESYG